MQEFSSQNKISDWLILGFHENGSPESPRDINLLLLLFFFYFSFKFQLLHLFFLFFAKISEIQGDFLFWFRLPHYFDLMCFNAISSIYCIFSCFQVFLFHFFILYSHSNPSFSCGGFFDKHLNPFNYLCFYIFNNFPEKTDLIYDLISCFVDSEEHVSGQIPLFLANHTSLLTIHSWILQ